MLIIADLKGIIRLAKKYGCTVIIDNTFATPQLVRPLTMGADMVIHSVTKYLAGHGNITAGVICGHDKELLKQAIEYRKWVGHMLSPDDAARLEDQLKTFEVRFEKQCSNAAYLASVLQKHPKVERVLYPGLPRHPTHDLAKELFGDRGYGGMITFDLAGSDDGLKKKRRDDFIERVSGIIPLIPTLGDVETTLIPVEAVWGDKYPLPGMIRLSVGIESVQKLEQTINRALNE
jgi:cystathionine beta-lyase/cystathionine gamma-synthase